MHTGRRDKVPPLLDGMGMFEVPLGGPRGGGRRGGMWGTGGWGGPWSGMSWGTGGPAMGGGGPGRRRMRRGDIRKAVLAALADGPANGYEVMSRLEERSGGMWRPSPGSVYPTLQMLEDEGLARSESRDSQKIYSLTPEGEAEANKAVSGDDSAPWEFAAEGTDGVRALRHSMVQMIVATKQVFHAGSPDQMERANQILNRARKELYGLLAEE